MLLYVPVIETNLVTSQMSPVEEAKEGIEMMQLGQ